MLADRVVDPPVVLLLSEVAHQHLHRQAALHLELRVQPFASARDLVAGEVGADDLDPPIARAGRHSDRIIAIE